MNLLPPDVLTGVLPKAPSAHIAALKAAILTNDCDFGFRMTLSHIFHDQQRHDPANQGSPADLHWGVKRHSSPDLSHIAV